jgi:hypothetical protein
MGGSWDSLPVPVSLFGDNIHNFAALLSGNGDGDFAILNILCSQDNFVYQFLGQFHTRPRRYEAAGKLPKSVPMNTPSKPLFYPPEGEKFPFFDLDNPPILGYIYSVRLWGKSPPRDPFPAASQPVFFYIDAFKSSTLK